MVDFKIVKKIVVDDQYGDQKKSGDKYRSMSKQIDNIIEEINDKESIFHILSQDVCSEEDIAQIIIQYLKRPPEYRMLVSNTKKGKYCKKASVLLTYDDNDIDQNIEARKMVPELGKPLIDISSYKKNIYKCLTNIPSRLNELDELDESIRSNEASELNDIRLLQTVDVGNVLYDVLLLLKKEKLNFFQKNIYSHCVKYTELYSDLCMYSILATLFFWMKPSYSKLSRKNTLNQFSIALDDIRKIAIEHIKSISSNKDKQYMELKARTVENFDDKLNISSNLTHFINTNAYYKHLNTMDDILVEELNDETYTPFETSITNDLKNIEHIDQIYDIIKNYVAIHGHINDIDDKILNIESLLHESEQYKFHYGSTLNKLQYLIAFQEVYMSKSTYNRKTAKRTVGRIFSKDIPKPDDFIDIHDIYFLDRKFFRGYFTIMGIVDEYKVFIEITKKCRDLFLLPFWVVFDIAQYEIAYYIASIALSRLFYIDFNQELNYILKSKNKTQKDS